MSNHSDSECWHRGSCFKPAVFALRNRKTKREISVCAPHMEDYPEADFEVLTVFASGASFVGDMGQGTESGQKHQEGPLAFAAGAFKSWLRGLFPGFMGCLDGK